VPYPYATDDHQSHNAVPFVEAGAARVVTDADLDRPVFESTLTELLEDPALRVKMAAAALSLGRPDAAAAVVAVVREAALRRSSSESGRGAR
jgi:UDP-N-acetylglucosamine--N-acetylmuramyl-(pentapeptide) pyrophosphoryl-undecaprenol N-acetylglucosamine transferase